MSRNIFPNKTLVTVEDLQEQVQIIYGDLIEDYEDMNVLRKQAMLDRKQHRNMLSDRNHILVDNIALFKQLIRDELGVTVMPGIFINEQELAENPNLKRVLYQDESQYMNYFLLYSQKEQLKPYEISFIQKVETYFAQWNIQQKNKD